MADIDHDERIASLSRLRTLARQLAAAGSADAACKVEAESVRGGAAVVREEGGGEGVRSLAAERAAGSFDVAAMTRLLYGGESVVKLREEIMAELEADAVLGSGDSCDLSRAEAREAVMRKLPRAWQMFMADGSDLERREARLELLTLVDPAWSTRNGVHFGLFMGALLGQGHRELTEEIMTTVVTLGFFGSFAMTEMGHGSYVRGIETTARYDAATEEFVINTPTITATKWWIGGVGQTSTHTVCFARLLLGDEDKGVHTFFVQLRDLDTHEPLPGVVVGDCGAKMGRNGLDNGWIQFHDVRIPRNHMLQKWAQVSADGSYTRKEKPQMEYAALLGGRSFVVRDAAEFLKLSATIAIRYSLVRRQFALTDDSGKEMEDERQLLDYQTHQFRLLPILATAYAFHFTGSWMKSLTTMLNDGLEVEDASALPDVHATSAGLKAFCTWYTNSAIERCRQCLGGHGYSKYARLSELFSDFAVQCTWEGDNTVMAQQTARYLMRSYDRVLKGESLSGSVRYLEDVARGTDDKAWDADSRRSLRESSFHTRAFRFHAARSVSEVAAAMRALRGRGYTEARAWDECQVALVDAARAHCFYNIHLCFARALDGAPPALAKPLQLLSSLFAVDYLNDNAAFFLRESYFTAREARLLVDEKVALCADLRRDALLLVDAFHYSDFVVGTPFGRYDGDVYKHYFRRVRDAPAAMERAPYFHSLIKPMLDGEHMYNAAIGESDDTE